MTPSKKAYINQVVSGKAKGFRQEIYSIISNSNKGRTLFELKFLTEKAQAIIASRVSELQAFGLIYSDDEIKFGGRLFSIYKATPKELITKKANEYGNLKKIKYLEAIVKKDVLPKEMNEEITKQINILKTAKF